MTKIIVTASPIYGHFAPMRAVAADLVKRGHQVTVLTGSAFQASVEATGATFAPLTGSADFDFIALATATERLALPPGLPQFEWDMRTLFVGPIPDQHQSLQDLLLAAGDEPVVVLHETGFLGVAPLMLGAPGRRPTAFIGIGVTPFTLSSIDTAPFGMGLPPDSSDAGRERNREAYGFLQGQVLAPAQALFTEILSDLGSTEPAPFFLDAPVLHTDRFLQLAVEELSYERSDTPEHVRFIGTLPLVTPAGLERPEWWGDVESAETLVVVTQGTVANHDFADLIEPTIEALADRPVLVVAATGREGEVRDVPANARIAEFISFDDLLPRADVLVTNGGFGAVQQSLSYGTPMVLAGLTEDKLEGNVRVAATGAAVNLAVDRPDPADIRKAVEDVLDDPSYRINAERLQAEYAATDPMATIVATVKELAP